MLPICYLFFMSLSAGVALLQPTLLSATDQLVKPKESSLEATDQLVKPEERALEVTDQLVKPEERALEVAQEAAATPPSGLLKEQEKKEKKEPKEQTQVSARQPTGPSGFGYAVTNSIGNLIKIIDVGVIGFFLLYWIVVFLRKQVSENLLIPFSSDTSDNPWRTSCICMLVSALVALVAKSFFYFVKGHAWFKARATLFMSLLQLLLIVLVCVPIQHFARGERVFSMDTVNLFSWMLSSHLLTLLLDLSVGSILQRSTRSSSLFG